MKLAMESCEEGPVPFYAGYQMIRKGIHHLVMAGDDPYYNSSGSGYGYTLTAINTSSTITNIEDRVHRMFKKSGWRELKAEKDAGRIVVSWAGGDDHRWADSCDHTVSAANLGGGPTGATTQAQVNTIAQNWYTAHRNLANTYWNYPTAALMLSNNGDIPSACFNESQTPSASWFPIIYHYVDWGFGGVLGGSDIRVIVLDNITYRDPFTDTDNSSKELWGPVQEAWLEAAIRDAWSRGFKYIVLASSKKRFEGTTTGRYGSGRNTDTFLQYSSKFDALMNRLDADGINGIIMLSGDRHTPTVNYSEKGVNGNTYNLLDITGCPTGVEHNADGQSNNINTIWVRSSPNKFGKGFNVFNYCNFTPEYAELSICDSVTGSKRWSCRVAPRSCRPYYV